MTENQPDRRATEDAPPAADGGHGVRSGSGRADAPRFERLVQSSPDLVIVLDAEARLSYVSPVATPMLGYHPDEVVGRSCFDLVHPDDVERVAEAFAKMLATSQPEVLSLRVRHRDGSYLPVETLGSDLFDDPLVQGLVVNVRDVSEREQIAATLREVEVRFQQAWEHSPIGMGMASSDGRLLGINPALCLMLGYPEDELIGCSIIELTHPDDCTRAMECMQQLWSGELADCSIEIRLRHRTGEWLWARATATLVRDATGAPSYIIGHIEDVTERRQFEQRLAYDATHDSLTGLPVRSLLLEHLELALAGSARQGTRVAALFIDLDHFKRVNDALGHAAGDELLVAVADRLRTAVRDADLPARFGGDEFVVMCPGVTEVHDVVAVAQRIRALLSRPFLVHGLETFVGASVGIAISDDETDAGTLLRQADIAAYRAKARGRNRYEIFDDELRASVAARSETESALRRGLDCDEFELLYQPVVELRTGALVGFEALVRWHRPGHGLLSPRDFLPVAEESGLIVPLGRQVLRKACRQLAIWSELVPERSVWLAVNLSTRQLLQPELADDLRGAVELAGAPLDRLYVEFSEALLDQDAAHVTAVLRSLADQGVQLALDDFGTGSSSIVELEHLPVSVLKIDGTMVGRVGADPQAAMILGSIVSLAHGLGMHVVGENVETDEQLRRLRGLGCDWAQGRLVAPPAPEVEATALLRASTTAAPHSARRPEQPRSR